MPPPAVRVANIFGLVSLLGNEFPEAQEWFLDAEWKATRDCEDGWISIIRMPVSAKAVTRLAHELRPVIRSAVDEAEAEGRNFWLTVNRGHVFLCRLYRLANDLNCRLTIGMIDGPLCETEFAEVPGSSDCLS